MKSLKWIMTLIKILHILSIIVFAFCIVGGVGCILGMSLLWAVKDVALPGGKTAVTLLSENGLTISSAYVYMANGVVIAASNAFLAIFINKFFKSVIDDDTPFTRKTVKNMRRVAIVFLIVSFAACVLCALSIGIAKAIDKGMPKVDLNNWFSLGFSISLLILSLFVEYPVELEEQKRNTVESEPAEVEVVDSKDNK